MGHPTLFSGHPNQIACRRISQLDFQLERARLIDRVHTSKSRARLIEEQYRKWLSLFLVAPRTELAPTPEIDEFWHEHITNDAKYRQDCLHIFGRLLKHLPQGDAARQDSNLATTKTLWERCFGEPAPFSLAGSCAGRTGGNPCKGRLDYDYFRDALEEDDPRAAFPYYSCFVSYSHADVEFVRRLTEDLERIGVRCFLDEKDILPGEDLYDEVDDAIRVWDKLLLCCSEASLTSWWVDNEISVALEKEQQLTKLRGRKLLVIIPLNLDGYLFSEDWKSGYRNQIRRRLAADFTDWQHNPPKFRKEFDKLVLALRADLNRSRRKPKPKL